MKNFIKPLLFLFLMISFLDILAQKKVYVDAGNVNKLASTLDGTTWAKAYASLEVALDKNLNIENIVFYIAEGTYSYPKTVITGNSFIGGYPKGGADQSDYKKYLTYFKVNFELRSPSGKRLYENTVIKNITFLNSGYIDGIFKTPVEISNCTFIGSGCRFWDCVVLINNSTITQSISSFEFKRVGLTIYNSTFNYNHSGIDVTEGKITIVNSKFNDNSKYGVNLIHLEEVILENSSFDRNGKDGLYIDNYIGVLIPNRPIPTNVPEIANSTNIYNCSFSKNLGMGIQIKESYSLTDNQLKIKNSVIDGNKQWGIYVLFIGNILEITSTTISNNGNEALYIARWPNITIKDSFIDSNKNGLLIYDAKNVTIEGTNLLSQKQIGVNLAIANGIQLETLKLKNSQIYGNLMGGIVAVPSKILEIENCNFDGNGEFGLSTSANNFSLKSTKFSKNTKFGCSISASNLVIDKCQFLDNKGGGIKISASRSEISNSDFLRNSDIGLTCNYDASLNLINIDSKDNKSGINLYGNGSINVENIVCSANIENGLYIYGNNTQTSKFKNILLNNNGLNGLYLNTLGKLTITESNFLDNKGNGIYSDRYTSSNVSLTLQKSSISGNKLDGINLYNSAKIDFKSLLIHKNGKNGMILYNYNGEVDSCIILNNPNAGIVLGGQNISNLTVSNSLFEDLTVGVISAQNYFNGTLIIKRCQFVNNNFRKDNTLFTNDNIWFANEFPYQFSSAIQYWGGQLKIDESKFIGNKSKGKNSGVEGNGSAIFNYLGNTVITNSFFHDNSATGAGGAIFSEQSGLSIYNSVFTQNISSNQGGAVMISGKPTRDSEIINCTFFDNRTYDLDGGGAISNNSTKAINIKNSIFYKNKQNKANNIFSSDIYAKTGTLNINRTVLQLDSLKYKTTPNINFSGVGNYYNKDPKFLLPAYLEDSAKAYLRGADNLFGTKDDALRLRSDSPFLNIGINSFNATSENPSGLDIVGNERIQEFVIDLGAYEGGVKVVHSIPLPTEKVIAEGSIAIITLATLTDYGNPVTYALVSGPATLKDNVLTPTGKPGKIVVTGKANGTEKDVTISICVNPSKPTITLRDVEGDFFLKSSTTTGNVWYNNDKKTTLTTQEITAIYDSFYTLQIDIESCVSAFSDKIVIPKDKVHTIGIITLTDLKEGNEKTIDLPTKTDFGNTVNYTITGPATIVNGKLTVGNKPGLVQIVGKANKTTKDVNYKFCVIPNKPTITLIDNAGVYKIKSSSSDGNVWYKNDIKITNTAQEISADYEATYKLQIDLSGCLSEQSEKITIPKLIILSIESGSGDDIMLYPNPLNNKLTIKTQSYVNKLSLKIIDTNGRMMLTEKYNSVSNDISLDLTNLASGTYLIELETNTIKIIKKLIKQ